MCFRKRTPSPTPSCAPSINPGTSATTNVRPLPGGDIRIGRNHAEMRLQSSERIRSDFRTRRGNARNQRGFSGVRKSDQAHIREQFQFQAQVALFARLAIFVLARSLVPRLREMRLPRPPCPPRAARYCWPGSVKSKSCSPVSSSKTIVPTGTFKIVSTPDRPWQFEPSPWPPAFGLEIRDCSDSAAGCCRAGWIRDRRRRRCRHRHPKARRAARTSPGGTRCSRFRRRRPLPKFWLRQQTRCARLQVRGINGESIR